MKKKSFILFLGGLIIALIGVIFGKKKQAKRIDGDPVEDKLNELKQEIERHSAACKRAGELLDEFNKDLLKEMEDRNKETLENKKVILEN